MKVKAENNTIYTKQEFKDLQMKWYKKLDASGFTDIERTGRYRQTYFNEYTGRMRHKALFQIEQSMHSLAYEYYSNLRSFSYYSAKLHLIDRQNYTSQCRLSLVDKIVLRMAGEGETIAATSKLLRLKWSHRARHNRTGPVGPPFSTYWVHHRLQELVRLAKLYQLQESKY